MLQEPSCRGRDRQARVEIRRKRGSSFAEHIAERQRLDDPARRAQQFLQRGGVASRRGLEPIDHLLERLRFHARLVVAVGDRRVGPDPVPASSSTSRRQLLRAARNVSGRSRIAGSSVSARPGSSAAANEETAVPRSGSNRSSSAFSSSRSATWSRSSNGSRLKAAIASGELARQRQAPLDQHLRAWLSSSRCRAFEQPVGPLSRPTAA